MSLTSTLSCCFSSLTPSLSASTGPRTQFAQVKLSGWAAEVVCAAGVGDETAVAGAVGAADVAVAGGLAGAAVRGGAAVGVLAVPPHAAPRSAAPRLRLLSRNVRRDVRYLPFTLRTSSRVILGSAGPYPFSEPRVMPLMK